MSKAVAQRKQKKPQWGKLKERIIVLSTFLVKNHCPLKVIYEVKYCPTKHKIYL